MQYRQLSPESYTKIIRSHPKKHFAIEQSPIWGAFQASIPGRTYLGTFLLHKNEQPIATLSLVQLKMRGYSYVWANQGPVFLHEPTQAACNEAALAIRRIVRSHARAATRNHLLFIRAHFAHKPQRSLEAYSSSLIERTTIVDLAQPFGTILERMNYGARRGMRKAAKAGFSIREVPASEAAANFKPYYAILQETAARDGYFIHPAATYQNMLRQLGQHIRFFAAFDPAGKPAAWALVTFYYNHAEYYYGASNKAARDAMAPYLLHIEAMRQLQSEGATAYDFLGISSKKFSGLEGVTQFKMRFGGDVVDYAPIYDLPLSPLYQPWKWAQSARTRLRHR